MYEGKLKFPRSGLNDDFSNELINKLAIALKKERASKIVIDENQIIFEVSILDMMFPGPPLLATITNGEISIKNEYNFFLVVFRLNFTRVVVVLSLLSCLGLSFSIIMGGPIVFSLIGISILWLLLAGTTISLGIYNFKHLISKCFKKVKKENKYMRL